MRMLGKFTTFVLVVVAAVAALTGWRSIPDIKRYLKMRQM
jgi:hypothetical protein